MIRAAGETGEETIALIINLIPVATFNLTTTNRDYTYNHSGSLTPDQVRVEFTNDGVSSSGGDRNAIVDYIVIGGTVYQSESPDVYSTGTWDAVNGCSPGNKQSHVLHCTGYFQFGTPTPLQSSVVVRAAGTTGGETVQLSVDERPVANFRLTTTMANYTYRHTRGGLRPEQVRIKFLDPGNTPQGVARRARIDRVSLNGTPFQTEAPQVYSTGTWDASTGCSPGYKRSEFLQCAGYFQFGSSTLRSVAQSSGSKQNQTSQQIDQALLEVVGAVSRTAIAEPIAPIARYDNRVEAQKMLPNASNTHSVSSMVDQPESKVIRRSPREFAEGSPVLIAAADSVKKLRPTVLEQLVDSVLEEMLSTW